MFQQTTAPNLKTVELQKQISPHQFIHIQHGLLCHGTVLRPGVLFVKNCSLNSDQEINRLTSMVQQYGNVTAVEKFMANDERQNVCGEFVVGSPCKISLWHSSNLAIIDKLQTASTRADLKTLATCLNQDPFIPTVTRFAEELPIARFPGKDLQNKKIGLICVAYDDQPGIIRYSSETTHNIAYHTVYGELLLTNTVNPRNKHFTEAHSAHCIFTLQEFNALYADPHYPRVAFFSDVIAKAVNSFDPDLMLKEFTQDLY